MSDFGLMTAGAAVMALAGAGLLAAAWVSHRGESRLLADGMRVDGVVVAVRSDTRTSSARAERGRGLRVDPGGDVLVPIELPRVRFTNSDGAAVEIEGQGMDPGTDSVGDTLEVRYLASEPGAARLSREMGRGAALLLSILGGAALVPGLVLLLWFGVTRASGNAPAGHVFVHGEVVAVMPIEPDAPDDDPFCLVVVRWRDELTGASRDFESPCALPRDEARQRFLGAWVPVRMNPRDPTDYEVDLTSFQSR